MGTDWQRLIEKMEKGDETRFTMDWYLDHPITQQLLQADIQWGKTLEVASGIGVRAILLRQQKNCRIVGIDIDSFAVEYANKMAQEKFGFDQDEASFSKGSFYEIPFPDTSFDNVILLAGLEHAFYPVKVLDEIQRVIREGGKLFLSITENNYHADPDHKSSWNEASLKRLLSSYGNVVTWVNEKIIFAILEFRKRQDEPKVVICDLNIKDAYTPYWIDGFNKFAHCEVVSLQVQDMQFANLNVINSILQFSQGADLLLFGTGAAFSNMGDICLNVKQANPNIVISKWFGDATDISIQEDRYFTDVYNSSKYFDQVFMVDTKQVGQIAPSCGQFFLNGLYDPKSINGSLSWQDRPIDVLCMANSYSQERFENIKSFLPKGKFRFLWIGDGSFHGRMPRQLSNKLYGLTKIILNVVDSRHRKTQHWISNRAYWAMASGALVFSSPIDGLEDLFHGGIVVLGDDPAEWQSAYEHWLSPQYHNRAKEIIDLNQEQLAQFHTFDYKVYTILRHGGQAVSLPLDVLVNVDSVPTSAQEDIFDFDLFENEYILRQPVSSLSVSKKLELGCGTTKSFGFIGADRFALNGVDTIIDLNKTLPFANDSVDLIYASHALEHIEDLMFTMSEIYRICKHGAQVCIVAPYHQQGLNFANPYHKQVFNEHTPRFWTNYHNVPIEKAEYDHPASYLWGLAESDNSSAQIDLRILRMEFFYFPEYRNLSVNEQRVARKKNLDVCDQIMYNLVVVKENIEDAKMAKLPKEMNLYEPPYVTIRKMREASVDTEQKLSQAEQKLSQAEQKLSQAEQELINIKSDAIQLKARYLNILNELAGMRESRIFRLADRLRRSNLLNILNPAFQHFLDDSYIFQNVKGFLLQPSVNLQKVDFLSYRLKFNRPGLRGVWVAPLLDIPLQQGVIGIELVSPESKIVLQQAISINDLRVGLPGHFVFAPVLETQHGMWEIRIFARDIEGPARLAEWRKYSWGGLGRLMTRAFFAFDFS